MPSGGGNTTTVSRQELSPEQRELLGGVIPVAKDYLANPLQQFPGSTVAGLTDTQTGAREMLSGAATGQVAPLAASSINASEGMTTAGSGMGMAGIWNLLNNGMQGTQGVGEILAEYGRTQGSRDFLSSGALLDPATNPVLAAQSQAALRPITQNLTETVLPSIRSDFVNSNMFGSSRQGIAESGAIRDYLRQAGDITTDLQANNFNQGLGAMLQASLQPGTLAGQVTGQALGAGEAGSAGALDAALRSLSLNPSLAQLAFLPGMTMEGLGESERQLNQAYLSEAAQRYSTEQMMPFLQAQDVANLAFGIGGGSATTSAQQNAAFNPIGTMLGGMMLLPMLGGLMG